MCLCVCCVHADVVLLSGLEGLFSTTFNMLLRCVFVAGSGRGEAALLLFLAHYIIIIINIIAVLLLVLQLFSF